MNKNKILKQQQILQTTNQKGEERTTNNKILLQSHKL